MMSELKLDSRIRLHDGNQMPLFGLGVWAAEPGRETYDAVVHALKTGYRHIDTAQMYGNEKDVGDALKDSGVPREEVFLTSKVWESDHGYEATLKAFDACLRKMSLDYIDLYLIHWPASGSRIETWKALEQIKKNGLCKSIGVSNYAPHHLEEIMELSGEKTGGESDRTEPLSPTAKNCRILQQRRNTSHRILSPRERKTLR